MKSTRNSWVSKKPRFSIPTLQKALLKYMNMLLLYIYHYLGICPATTHPWGFYRDLEAFLDISSPELKISQDFEEISSFYLIPHRESSTQLVMTVDLWISQASIWF